MAMATTYHDRVVNINKLQVPSDIASSHKNAFPNESDTQARAEAFSIETNIFNQASSKEDYHRQCCEKVAYLDALTPVQALYFTPEPYSTVASTESSPAKTETQQGEKIGPYTNAIYHQRGLFSTIFKAPSSPPSSELLALKLTTPAQCHPPHDPTREARILRRAVHPSVIQLLWTFSLPNSDFLLVFPFLPLDLDTWLHHRDTASYLPPGALSHMRDLFNALSHIHSLGIIHRDVKPSNILLKSPSGPAYLADFGTAWMPGDKASEPVDEKIADVGTTSYRPPELLFGDTAYGCSLDLWAAGCVIAELFLENDETLFYSGALGSELALIQSIFKTLGTPTLETWPEATRLSSWGKVQFHTFPSKSWADILPQASNDARNLVSQLVRYESGVRLDACAVLEHPFFSALRSI